MRFPIQFVPPDTKFKFVKHWRIAVAETVITFIATIALLATLGLNLGVDFRGGTMIEIGTTDGPADIAEVRSTIEGLDLGEVQIQEFGSPTEVLIRVEEQPGGEAAQQRTAERIQGALGDNVEIRRVEVVGATVSGELIESAIWALAVAALGIFFYVWFRFEWQFSVAALIALSHDILLTVCLFSLLQIDFDLTIVAALLTLIGYAINDTVVMFDRVRENLRKYKKMPLEELIDLSVNQTLSRTVMTAGAILITLIALFIFGGPVIRGFAVAMLFGMAVSTYTSMYVAAPLLYVIGMNREADAPNRSAAGLEGEETQSSAKEHPPATASI